MNTTKEIFTIGSLKKGFLVCLKLSIAFTIIFSVIFQQFTLEDLGKTFLISSMFSFGMGFGNGLLNRYLSTKWDWITQTNQRVTAGIIVTIVYTVPLVLSIDYLTMIILNEGDPAYFFKGVNFFIHLFYIILSLGISTFLHAKGFMSNWKKAMTQ